MSKLLAKRALRSTLGMLAAVVCAIAAPVGSRAGEPHLATSIWCDRAEQIESVVRTHVADGVALPTAIARTNAAAQDPGACIAASAIVLETGETRRLVVGNQLISIEQHLVLGIMKDEQVLRIAPVTWYAARLVARLTAL